MRLYFVLFLLPLLGNGNLWFAPNKQTIATNTIYTQLEEKKAALDTLLTQHGLTIKDLSADEQQILAKMDQLIKMNAQLKNVKSENIGKNDFDIQFSNIIESYKGVLYNNIEQPEPIKTHLLVEVLERKLNKKKYSISSNLCEVLFKKIDTTKLVSRGKVAKIMYDNLNTYYTDAKIKELTKSINKGDNSLKKVKNLNDILLDEKAFEDTFLHKNLEDKVSDWHPDNLQEVREEEKEDFHRFKVFFNNWLSETKATLTSNIDSAKRGHIVDIKALLQNQNTYLQSPDFAKTYWKNVLYTLSILMVKEESLFSVERARILACEALSSNAKETQIKNLYLKYKETKVNDLPAGINNWLLNSSVAIDVSTFYTVVNKWESSVKSAIDVFVSQKISDKKDRLLKRDKVIQNFSLLFNDKLLGGSNRPFASFAINLTSKIPKEDTFQAADLQKAWSGFLKEVTTTQNLHFIYVESIINGFGSIQEMQTAINSVDNVLPSMASIVTACVNSKYYSPKKPNPIVVSDTNVITIPYLLVCNNVAGIAEEVASTVIAEAGLASGGLLNGIIDTGADLMEGARELVDQFLPEENEITQSFRLPVGNINLTFQMSYTIEEYTRQEIIFPHINISNCTALITTNELHDLKLESVTQNKTLGGTGTTTIDTITYTLTLTDVSKAKSAGAAPGSGSIAVESSGNNPNTPLQFIFTTTSTYIDGLVSLEIVPVVPGINPTEGQPATQILREINGPDDFDNVALPATNLFPYENIPN